KFKVKNTGNVPLRIFSRLEGGDANNFSHRDSCRRLRSLSPGKTCSIYASFNPKDPEGKKWTDLVIYYRQLLEIGPITPPSVRVRLTGYAVTPIPCSDASITIESRQNGRWNDPRTWSRIRPPIDSLTTPNTDDVVRINAKHIVKAYQPFLKNVKSLCIKPKAELFLSNRRCSPVPIPRRVGINATDLIKNEGTIKGKDGGYALPCLWRGNQVVAKAPLTASTIRRDTTNDDGVATFDLIAGSYSIIRPWWWRYPGTSIRLLADRISNYGQIITGKGLSGVRSTSGGNLLIQTRSNFYNRGTIIAGNGGDSSGRYAGSGGYITVDSGKNIRLRRISTTTWTGRRICGSDYDMSGNFVGASGDICAGNGGKLTSRTRHARAG
ncbi:hypothetical protein QUF54_10650, partial [Candidatus Marithioploca araucensis]|nr:hypothetical protein [Candidatus Marithioploca araucensis]